MINKERIALTLTITDENPTYNYTNQSCKWKIVKQICKDLPNIGITIPANKRASYLFRLVQNDIKYTEYRENWTNEK